MTTNKENQYIFTCKKTALCLVRIKQNNKQTIMFCTYDLLFPVYYGCWTLRTVET